MVDSPDLQRAVKTLIKARDKATNQLANPNSGQNARQFQSQSMALNQQTQKAYEVIAKLALQWNKLAHASKGV